MPPANIAAMMAGTDALVLPPLFTAVRLRELGDAFAHAQSIAATAGAGTLVHVGRFDLAEFAVVLEPDEPLREARRALYAGMAALADTLAGLADPETAIAIDWPDALTVNMGLVGGGQLAWPQDTREDEVPPWLVFGGMIRLASAPGQEPGQNPFSTALGEEGFGDIAAKHVIEGFARHLMVTIDAWQTQGFDAVGRSYLQYLPRASGVRRSIETNGDFVVARTLAEQSECQPLAPALRDPSWLDRQARGPKL